MTSRSPIPVRPAFANVSEHALRPLIRSGVAQFLMRTRGVHQREVLRNWPDDGDEIALHLRAANSPASLTDWDSQLTMTGGVASVLMALSQPSAGLQVLAQAINVDLTNKAGITVPSVIANADDAAFVREGDPLPLRVASLSDGALLKPYKLPVTFSFTNELAERSISNLETIFRQMAGESINAKVDKVLFDANAQTDGLRPAGLLCGVEGLPGTTSAVDLTTAIASDIGLLLDVLASAGGGSKPCLVTSVASAATLKFLANSKFDVPVYASAQIAKGRCIALDLQSLASGFAGLPIFDVSKETVVHMEDTSPSQLSTFGTPNTVAAPLHSLWQTDCSAIRVILRCSWGLRAPCIAYAYNCVW